jgi:hypothetical protein
VRSVTVVVIDELGKDRVELTPMEDQHAVEALSTDGANETLGNGIGPRRSDRRPDDPDALGAEDLVEVGREFGIPVPHEEPDGTNPIGSTMVRLRACWTTHPPTGLAVTPPT